MTNRHKMMTKSHMNHWVRGELKKERTSNICVNLLWTSYTWCIKHIDECVLLSSINTNQQMQAYFFCKNNFLSPRQYTKPNLMSHLFMNIKKMMYLKLASTNWYKTLSPFISTKYLLSQLIYMNCKRKRNFTMRKKKWYGVKQASKQAYCVHGVAL